MLKKNQLHWQQVLLDSVAINDCIQQGRYWSGHGLPWQMRERRQGGSGDFSSQQQGSGIDFSETRPYQPGDEPRHINWRATAKTGRPQVRVFHKDLTPPCYFLIDRRATMRFGTRTRLKVTQAARLAIFLASWEQQNNTAIGSLILNESLQWQPAVSGGQQVVHQLAQFVSRACPALDTETDLSFKHAVSLLADQIPQGSHVYLLSDFHDLNTDMQSQLYQLGQQNQVLATSIYDIAEQQLPHAGYLQLRWGKQQKIQNPQPIDTDDLEIQKACQLSFNKHQQQIKQIFEKADINYISISSQSNNLASALQAMPL